MKYTVDEVISVVSGYIFYKSPEFESSKQYILSGLKKFITDPKESIFIPKYVNINGVLEEDYSSLENLIQSGQIRCFMFDEVRFSTPKYYNLLMYLLDKYKNSIDLVVMVPDTVKAIVELAVYTRTKKMSKDVKYIAITGSVGKTSTTELLYNVLKNKFKVYRGGVGANIRLRIAHKFLETRPDLDYMLFECSGMNPGYLKQFSEMIMPDYAIITKIAAHCLGTFRTIENVAKEKITLLSALGENSVAILNEEYLHDFSRPYPCEKIFIKDGSYQLLNTDTEGSEFMYKNERYYLPVTGVFQIDNAVKVIELCKLIGLTCEDINLGFSQYLAPGNRWAAEKYSNGVELVIDNPNNPYDAILANIKAFSDLYKDKYKKVIITKINEVGNLDISMYLSLAKFLVTLPLDELICLGQEISLIADYVREHSNIKVVYFDKPKKLDENDPFVQYFISTSNFEQAILFKGVSHDGKINYDEIKNILDKVLK